MINQPKRRPIFVFIGLTTITLGLLFGGLQPISWAAPGQHPHQQTVPPRPTETPPVVASPTATPLPEASLTPEPGSPTDPESDDLDGSEETNEEKVPPTSESDPNEVPKTEETPPQTNNEQAELVDPAVTPSTETTAEESVDNAQSGETETGAELGANSAEVADLSLMMQVDTPQPVVGELITFTVVITNSGPNAATAVVVRDVLPTGLIFEGATASQGRYGPGSGLWQIDSLLPNETGILHLTGSVVGTGAVVNRAEVVAVTQADPDSVPNNRVDIEDDYASISLTVHGELALDLEPVSNSVGQQDITAEEAPADVDLATTADDGQFLYWLLALIGGGLLTVIGVVLVKRA